jgi:hypothetical protein
MSGSGAIRPRSLANGRDIERQPAAGWSVCFQVVPQRPETSVLGAERTPRSETTTQCLLLPRLGAEN